MSDLFKDKYRIDSSRLSNWDYSSEGMYFITINTHAGIPYFGHVTVSPKDEAYLSLTTLGKMAQEEWYKTVALRPDMNIELGELVVMPNHIHGIIIINENNFNGDNQFIRNNSSFGPQSKNVGSIIRGYKSAVTSAAGKHQIPFRWQERYYDHIIRSFEEYLRISNYILENPTRWAIKYGLI